MESNSLCPKEKMQSQAFCQLEEVKARQFYQKAVSFFPNPLQLEVWKTYAAANGHPALLIKAGTGTGKTEAILLPAFADQNPRRRVIMVLPSKALIEDMAKRVREIAEKLAQNDMASLDITVDMGGSCQRFSCRKGKCTERARDYTYYRHLFADDIIITTIDKFLFRLFGYGEKTKSYIFPHRVFGSSLGKRPFVIFDEAHEYEDVAFASFSKLLEALYVKGKDLCVMSATLSPQFVNFLEVIDATTGDLGQKQAQYQNDCAQKKEPVGVVNFDKQLVLLPSESTQDERSLVSTIAREVRSRHRPDLRLIARTEFVEDLVKLYRELKDLNPMVYHGRLTMQQRKKVIDEIIQRQKDNKGFLLIATSAIEAGCDLDAHTIVTELCNPDSLVQLAGRLNRRGKMNEAPLVVVGDKIKHLVSSLTPEQLPQYLATLHSMDGRFAPAQLQQYFHPPRADWMGEVLFDMLWDYVYEGDLTGKPLWEKGIMVTRSWEPSITLCTSLDSKNRPQNFIEIGISRLAKRIYKPSAEKDYLSWIRQQKVNDFFSCTDGKWHAQIYRAYYQMARGDEKHWTIYPLPEKSWVNCYETNLICKIEKAFVEDYFDEELGYINLPKIFRVGYRDGYRQYLECPQVNKDGLFVVKGNQVQHSGRVWYLDKEDK